VRALRLEHCFKLEPDRSVTTLVFAFGAEVYLHNKCLSHHTTQK
jgi:hypothetical protein